MGKCPLPLHEHRLFAHFECRIGGAAFPNTLSRFCLGVASGGVLDGAAVCHLPLRRGLYRAVSASLADVADFGEVALEDRRRLARVMASASSLHERILSALFAMVTRPW